MHVTMHPTMEGFTREMKNISLPCPLGGDDLRQKEGVACNGLGNSYQEIETCPFGGRDLCGDGVLTRSTFSEYTLEGVAFRQG